MVFKRIITVCIIVSFLLSGCANNSRRSSPIGPAMSSSFVQPEVVAPVVVPTKLDVIIPTFDPGLPADPADYKENNIWPELRRAEANRFAYKLKEQLDKTGNFGAVRVTPDSTATGDLYVLGRIDQSNGEEVEISIEVVDISGGKWLDDSFNHTVPEGYHRNLRNAGIDPYEPVFAEAAAAIVDELSDYDDKELAELHNLAELRFGANFSDSTFMQYMEVSSGEFALVRKPSDDDPMLQRVRAIRVRDQMFVDGLQDNYAKFTEQMNESYFMWQKQSLIEIEAERTARRKALGKAIGGVFLIGLAVLAVAAGANSDAVGSSSAAATGAIIGGMAGASLFSESFKTSKEAEVHREAINELGQSVDMDLGPQVIAFEKESVELTGNAKEQFMQWRTFLQKIYAEEMTPDIQL